MPQKKRDKTDQPLPASQNASNTGGQVIQAGRDVIINQPSKDAATPAPALKKNLLERWQAWVALVVAIVGLIAGMPKIVSEYRELFPAQTSHFSGSVRDTAGLPAAGAILRVQGKRGSDTTDANGDFDFEVNAASSTKIWVTVTKDGRVGFDDYVLLNRSASIPFDTTVVGRTK